MYNKEYLRWCEAVGEEYLQAELKEIGGNDEAIKERFLLNLEFGTAGLRGVLGAGTNRMNIYTVGKATQGLANFLTSEKENPVVTISYDSRIRSDEFAQVAAQILAANGVKVYLYDALAPVPMLSFATRAHKSDAGIMITASHNPAKYNGYKVYGPDGCQMTSESADKVLAEINKLDIFADIKKADFETAMAEGKIEYVSDEVKQAYYDWCLGQMMRKDIFEKEPMKMVYTPLNGSGLVPVTTVLAKAGLKDITIVEEQRLPDGNFPTCPYPNPEIREAMQLGLDRVKELDGDVLIATDPDADRVGIAVKENDEYVLLTGNQVGILLTDYIAKTRKELGTLPENPIMVKSIVSSSLADAVAASHGVETINVLTGFKYIGTEIKKLEEKGEEERFILGFEESYGYLVGSAVRDKDAVVATLLISEMAAYYRSIGSSINKALQDIYAKFGYYLNKVDSYEFEGLSGMDKMKDIMQGLRDKPLAKLGSLPVVAREDYKTLVHKDELTGEEWHIDLPNANILIYYLEGGHQVIVRPSGTEPKIKVYYSIKGKDLAEATEIKADIDTVIKAVLA
ncbi:MAG: phospho-sugar mutase [Oscillospiraceae bacterium]|nr:phospho-sugar mutase [Oscillospiraceae bacterium]